MPQRALVISRAQPTARSLGAYSRKWRQWRISKTPTVTPKGNGQVSASAQMTMRLPASSAPRSTREGSSARLRSTATTRRARAAAQPPPPKTPPRGGAGILHNCPRQPEAIPDRERADYRQRLRDALLGVIAQAQVKEDRAHTQQGMGRDRDQEQHLERQDHRMAKIGLHLLKIPQAALHHVEMRRHMQAREDHQPHA